MTRYRPLFGLCFLLSIGCLSDAGKDLSSSGDDTVVEVQPEPYGPENEWYHADAADVTEPDSCGKQLGQTMCNFTMTDQNGDSVELYQFFGKVVVLDLFAEW